MASEDLREIRDDIKTMIKHQANLLGKFDAHIDNGAVHQVPPCEAHKTLVGRLWAMAAAVLGAVGMSLYSLVKS